MAKKRTRKLPFPFKEPGVADHSELWKIAGKEYQASLVSEIAFHSHTGNRIICQAPEFLLNKTSQVLSQFMQPRHFISEELNDLICGPKKPAATIADLDSSKEMTWEVWSYLIDQKLFGRETPFSKITKQQAGI